MADVMSQAARSALMAKIKSKDTKPEMIVRRMVHSLGYRYRLHRKDLPGSPDLVFPSRKKVIFVNGCFWHRHRCKRGQSLPATRRDWWTKKFDGNVRRDQRNRRKLRQLEWKVLGIWECQVKRSDWLLQHIVSFLEDEG